MSTLKVNSIEANTGSEIDINSTLGTIPSIVVSGVSTLSGGVNASQGVDATGLRVTGITTLGNATATTLVVSGVSTVAAGSAAAPSITPTGDSNTGIFFPSADTIAFGEGGAEALRIDNSGRVGIGTTNPVAKLDVFQGSAYIGGISGDAYFVTYADVSGSNVSIEAINRANTIKKNLTLNAYGGNVLVGTTTKNITSPNNPGFEIHGTNTNGLGIYVSNAGNNNTMVVFQNTTGRVGFIDVNAASVTYSTSSDYRLKENVVPVADGIVRLLQLKPIRFNFITDPDNTVDGFIAHEVQDVVPEAISGEKDEIDDDGKPVHQGIDQSKLVPLLTAALQETIAKIETLEAKVAALEAA